MEFHQTAHLHRDDSGHRILSCEHVTGGHLATGSLPGEPCVIGLPMPLNSSAVGVILEAAFTEDAFRLCFLRAAQLRRFPCVVQSMRD